MEQLQASVYKHRAHSEGPRCAASASKDQSFLERDFVQYKDKWLQCLAGL